MLIPSGFERLELDGVVVVAKTGMLEELVAEPMPIPEGVLRPKTPVLKVNKGGQYALRPLSHLWIEITVF